MNKIIARYCLILIGLVREYPFKRVVDFNLFGEFFEEIVKFFVVKFLLVQIGLNLVVVVVDIYIDIRYLIDSAYSAPVNLQILVLLFMALSILLKFHLELENLLGKEP